MNCRYMDIARGCRMVYAFTVLQSIGYNGREKNLPKKGLQVSKIVPAMNTTPTCPHCRRADRQVRAGLNAGNQRYKCGYCLRRYTPVERQRGYSEAVKQEALAHHADGRTLREIAHLTGASVRSIASWLAAQRRQTRFGQAGAPEPKAAMTPIARSNRRPSIQDVATRAGVSVSTVSNYLNSKGRMSAATRERIRTAVEAINFAPNFHVRAIRLHRTRIIGVIIFGLGDLDSSAGRTISPAILSGIDLAADAVRHDILLYTGWTESPDRMSADRLLDGHIDGLVWAAPRMEEPVLERVAEAGVPLVALLSRHVPENVGYVNVDNIAGMHLLVNHLAQMGRRRIAYVGPAHSSDFIDRRDGFRQALSAAGLTWDPRIEIAPEQNIWDWPSYGGPIEGLLGLKDRPTAIITADDGLAAVAIEAIHRQGLRIPKDVAVTGFNDIPEATRLAGGLTTIRQDFRKIGMVGVERLIALIEGSPVEECRVSVPPELVVRGTSSPKKRSR